MEKPFCDYYELNKEKYQCLICGRCFLIVCDVQVLADHLQKNHLSQESDTNKPKYKEKYGSVGLTTCIITLNSMWSMKCLSAAMNFSFSKQHDIHGIVTIGPRGKDLSFMLTV